MFDIKMTAFLDIIDTKNIGSNFFMSIKGKYESKIKRRINIYVVGKHIIFIVRISTNIYKMWMKLTPVGKVSFFLEIIFVKFVLNKQLEQQNTKKLLIHFQTFKHKR